MELRLSFLIITCLLISGCSDDLECFQSTGEKLSYHQELSPFNSIEINDGISVEIIQSNDTLVKIETRENLKEQLKFEVVDKKLIIKDNNKCSWLKEYNQTKITISHPNLVGIDHLGSNLVYANDTLFYPSLKLYCKNAPGDIDLIINNNMVRVSIDDLNNIKLSGRCEELFVGIYAGDGRVNAEMLKADKVSFFQRGSNDILVYPIQRLDGQIIGNGDVVYYNEPIEVEVTVSGNGNLIYK